MLVYINFNMFDYTQTLIVFNEDQEISRTFSTLDTLPQMIVATCYNFNAFDVKLDYSDFVAGLAQQVALVEANKFNANKIKFI